MAEHHEVGRCRPIYTQHLATADLKLTSGTPTQFVNRLHSFDSPCSRIRPMPKNAPHPCDSSECRLCSQLKRVGVVDNHRFIV